MTIENLTSPGQPPSDGDLIRVTHASGATETKHWYTPAPYVPQPVATSAPADFIRIMTVALGGIARWTAVWTDPGFLYFRTLIERGSVVDWADVVDGLPMLVGADVVTQAEADALIAARPVA